MTDFKFMTDFKVGDQVICMPCGSRGYVKKIDKSATYPIVVYYTEHSNRYEGSYTFEGFRYTEAIPENRKYYITKDVAASAQISQPDTKTSPYWSIMKANSLFIYLTHASHGSRIIPITDIISIKTERNSVTLDTKMHTYDIGPIQFDKIANLLFTQQQSNSI